MGAGAGAKVHGVSGKNLLKLVMKKRCAHTDKNLKLLVRMHICLQLDGILEMCRARM